VDATTLFANDVIKELKPLTVAPVNRHSSTNGFGVSRHSNVCSIFTDIPVVCYFYKYRCNSEQRLGLRLQCLV